MPCHFYADDDSQIGVESGENRVAKTLFRLCEGEVGMAAVVFQTNKTNLLDLGGKFKRGRAVPLHRSHVTAASHSHFLRAVGK